MLGDRRAPISANKVLPENVGWRLAFVMGPAVSFKTVPENEAIASDLIWTDQTSSWTRLICLAGRGSVLL